ncbi:MAG TPA: alpha/beta hydrolase-fold protein [Pyrinomonadaceae bacterium]|nr:alpha/beta hydrolase-fold protein [Pyrinomonadaceae bacterium]
MRYRFFIARKPALTVCLLLIALWAPGSQSARRTAEDSAASSVRIIGPGVSTFLAAGVGEPVQPRPKAPRRLDSPRLMALERKVKTGNRAAIKQFWEEVQGKTPLVEPLPGDDQLRRVTFLWRGGAEASEVTLDGNFPPDSQDAPLMRLANTDVWFLTLRLPATARFTYGFNRSGKKQSVDPLNPLKFRSSSFVELPAAPLQSWITVQPDVPKGTLSQEKLRSENLKEERSVSIYTPPGYDPKNGSYGLLVLFDGQDYRGPMPIPTILDNLVAAKKIRPLVAILVDNLNEESRDRDLECYPPFVDFLAKELVPWARQRYRFSAEPERTIVGGVSLGGLTAAYCALRYPEVFGNVLSQSGAFSYFPNWDDQEESDTSPFGWLIQQFVTTRKLSIRFYLEAGLFENDCPEALLTQNRRMRDVLEAKGYSVVYSEFAGGHEFLSWRGSVADGLIALAGRGQ